MTPGGSFVNGETMSLRAATQPVDFRFAACSNAPRIAPKLALVNGFIKSARVCFLPGHLFINGPRNKWFRPRPIEEKHECLSPFLLRRFSHDVSSFYLVFRFAFSFYGRLEVSTTTRVKSKWIPAVLCNWTFEPCNPCLFSLFSSGIRVFYIFRYYIWQNRWKKEKEITKWNS